MPKVAAIQMCSAAEVEINLIQAKKLIERAVQAQAQLVVLPEMFALFDVPSQDLLKHKESYGSGPIQDFLASQAQLYQTWILGGTIPLTTEHPNLFSAASLLYDANGLCVARYDKIHLFDVTLSATESYRESDLTEPGQHLSVISTPIGKLGISVCFDLRFPEQFTALAQLGAEVLAIPAAFTEITGRAHWEILTRCRAIDHFSYLIGAAQGGVHAHGRKTYGHSLIVNPWGEVIVQQKDKRPGVICAEIELNQVDEARKAIPL